MPSKRYFAVAVFVMGIFAAVDEYYALRALSRGNLEDAATIFGPWEPWAHLVVVFLAGTLMFVGYKLWFTRGG